MAGSILISGDEFHRKVVDAIVRSANPEKVFLFGSSARGDATADSDLDLLIVDSCAFGPAHSRSEVIQRIREALSELQVSKDILVFSPEEFAK